MVKAKATTKTRKVSQAKKAVANGKKPLPLNEISKSDLQVLIGFDVSSSTVGWGVFYVMDGIILKVDYGHYKPKDKEDILDSIFSLHDYVMGLISKVDIEADEYAKKLIGPFSKANVNVCVEDFLLYMPDKSSARTVTILSVYNRTVCLAVHNMLGKQPILLPVATIRSSLKKLSGASERVDKEHVPDTVEKIVNDKWTESTPWKFLWLLNRNKKPIEECFDMGDGMAAGLAGALKLGILEVNK